MLAIEVLEGGRVIDRLEISGESRRGGECVSERAFGAVETSKGEGVRGGGTCCSWKTGSEMVGVTGGGGRLREVRGGPVMTSSPILTFSTGGKEGSSARGVGCSSLAKPFEMAPSGSCGFFSIGVTTSSGSDSSSFGVAAPLSLETHSSSSPSSEGLAIENPILCFELTRGTGARRIAAGLTCSLDWTLTLLFVLDTWPDPRPFCGLRGQTRRPARGRDAHLQMKIPPGLIGVFRGPRILLGELKVESELSAAARRRPRVRASEAAACAMPFGGHGG